MVSKDKTHRPSVQQKLAPVAEDPRLRFEKSVAGQKIRPGNPSSVQKQPSHQLQSSSPRRDTRPKERESQVSSHGAAKTQSSSSRAVQPVKESSSRPSDVNKHSHSSSSARRPEAGQPSIKSKESTKVSSSSKGGESSHKSSPNSNTSHHSSSTKPSQWSVYSTSHSTIQDTKYLSSSTIRPSPTHRPSSKPVQHDSSISHPGSIHMSSSKPNIPPPPPVFKLRPLAQQSLSSSQINNPQSIRLPNVAKFQISVDQRGTFLQGRDRPEFKSSRPSGLRSVAPPTTKSILVSQKDVLMASRQAQYSQLKGRDLEEQETWAQAFLESFAPCPHGWGFARVDDGYQCHGRHHLITDDQLAEGKGGMWMLPNGDQYEPRVGPYYPHPMYPTHFPYAGELPIPDSGWEFTGESLQLISRRENWDALTDEERQAMQNAWDSQTDEERQAAIAIWNAMSDEEKDTAVAEQEYHLGCNNI